ncbi:MAG: metallophosphoesterase [Bacteroidales bacterium]|nr:metallophosphoesterase [Candidatus Latescibacterota bacterium]
MIIFVGDVHAEFDRMAAALTKAPRDAQIIQVGDFGIWPNCEKRWARSGMQEFEKPVLFIDGNHECFPMLSQDQVPKEIWPGAVHVPRGSVLRIDSYTIGFLGGGTSIDKAYRKGGTSWFADEQITEEQLRRFDGQTIDILVTHTPPAETIARNFDSRIPISFGFDADFIDPEAHKVEKVWHQLGRPKLFCGHMHSSVQDGPVRILDICEAYALPEKRR